MKKLKNNKRRIKFQFKYNNQLWEWEKDFYTENNGDITAYLEFKQKYLPISIDNVIWKQIG